MAIAVSGASWDTIVEPPDGRRAHLSMILLLTWLRAARLGLCPLASPLFTPASGK